MENKGDKESNQESDSNNNENSNKEIDLNHCVYAGIMYDTSKVYCHFCGKHLNPEKDPIDEFYPIVPDFFLCLSHYKAFLMDEKFKAQFQSKIRHAFVSTFVKQVFFPPPIPQQSVPLHMPFDLFLPTIKFHCQGNLEDVKCEDLEKILGDKVFIYDVEKGSSTLFAAVLYDIKWNDFQMASEELKNRMASTFNEIKQSFRPAIEQSLVGEFVDDPVVNVPNLASINELARNKATNIIQNFREFDQFELEQIIHDLLCFARDERSRNYFRAIINNKEEYDIAEKQIINDIKMNPYELTIVRESVIINKFDQQYKELKGTISEDKINECFLYHGTRLENHYGIINTSFNVPGQDQVIHMMKDTMELEFIQQIISFMPHYMETDTDI